MALFDDTRSDWDADSPTYSMTYVNPANRVGRTWHWAGPPCYLFGKSHQACLDLVESWQDYHQSKDWGDIGYNALICVHARAIEGRGLDYVGAHSPGHNTSHYGIQFMVGEGEEVTAEMFDRGSVLASALHDRSGHGLEDEGHCDNTQTSCPGSQIYSWVNAGGPETGDEMLNSEDKEWIKDELARQLRITLTDFQKEEIGTSSDTWPGNKMWGYLGGQVAYVKGLIYDLQDSVDAIGAESSDHHHHGRGGGWWRRRKDDPTRYDVRAIERAIREERAGADEPLSNSDNEPS